MGKTYIREPSPCKSRAPIVVKLSPYIRIHAAFYDFIYLRTPPPGVSSAISVYSPLLRETGLSGALHVRVLMLPRIYPPFTFYDGMK